MKNKNIEIYSTFNEEKSVVAERFIRPLENKIFKEITDISKSVYFVVFDDIVNKYNNTVHKTIKVKPVDVSSDSYSECNEDSNENILNLKLVIMSEYQNAKIFLLKDILRIGLKKFLSLVKIKIQFFGLMILVI